MSWCPSCSNSLWQGWSCGLVHCPGGNATDPISRVLASSNGISSWTPLKPQNSDPNPNPLANQLWCIDFLTPSTPLIIPHRLPGFLESLMPLKNRCSSHARWLKSSLSWCPSLSNGLWQGWSCGLVYCPGGNATEPIWRVLASSDGISSWTSLKPQHSNPKPNPNPLAYQLWFIDFFTPPTPLIIHHRLLAFLESLMLLINWCSSHARWLKSSLKHSIRFCGIFSKFKNTILLHIVLLKCQIAFFENHQLWQSGFSRVYSNSYCSSSFEAEIMKIGQSSHKMYSNKILNSQESMTISNAHSKNTWKLIICTS